MSYAVKILADSTSPGGVRLTTFEVTFPRFILAEVNTHRVFSRNSASSRAIPTEKIIERVIENPFIPEFNKRVKGMGVGAALSEDEDRLAVAYWVGARSDAVKWAEKLLKLDVDKSRVNRLLEPFMWHTALITSTEWNNFFALRADETAQPEFRTIAEMMLDLYQQGSPPDSLLNYGEWHLPLVSFSELVGDPESTNPINWDYWKKVSVGRCARVSYLTHDGVRDPQADIELHDRLMASGHLSPFEHVATPLCPNREHPVNNYLGEDGGTHNAYHGERSGNFVGWHQYRKDIPNEQDFSLVK